MRKDRVSKGGDLPRRTDGSNRSQITETPASATSPSARLCPNKVHNSIRWDSPPDDVIESLAVWPDYPYMYLCRKLPAAWSCPDKPHLDSWTQGKTNSVAHGPPRTSQMSQVMERRRWNVSNARRPPLHKYTPAEAFLALDDRGWPIHLPVICHRLV